MAQKTAPKNCKRAAVSLIRSTHSLRALAMSNQVKEKLLGEGHDPHSAQTESVRKTWQLFSSIDVLRDDQIAHCIRSLTGHVDGITPTRKHANERSGQLMKMGMVNPYYFTFPAKASEDFSNSAEGMLWYLLGLTKYPHDIQPTFATSLVFDIATCIALVHADKASTSAGRSKAFLIGLQFWDHALGMETRQSLGNLWISLRRHYYAELRELGISFRDIHELVGPIKILGETNMLKQLAPSSNSHKLIPLKSATNQVVYINQGGVEVIAPDQHGNVMPSQIKQVTTDIDLIGAITCARHNQLA